MGWRCVISISNGKAKPQHWLAAVATEPSTKAKPDACHDCPLRIGGEWEGNVTEVLEQMKPRQRARMKRWNCHAGQRPCAGMLRLVAVAERGEVAPAQGGPKEAE